MHTEIKAGRLGNINHNTASGGFVYVATFVLIGLKSILSSKEDHSTPVVRFRTVIFPPFAGPRLTLDLPRYHPCNQDHPLK